MDYLFSGVSIITIGGLIYKGISLFLSKKTDIIFFTQGRKLLLNIIEVIIMLIIMISLIYTFPLQFPGVYIADSILAILDVIFRFIFIVIIIIYLLSQFKIFESKKYFKDFYNKKIYGVILIYVLLIYGWISVYKMAEYENNNYTNSFYIFGFSALWATISVIMFQIYKSEHKKVISQACWINYTDLDSKKVKYYIYYALDNEYVVCGKENKYEDNDEFRYIKIEEIKAKHIVHFDIQEK